MGAEPGGASIGSLLLSPEEAGLLLGHAVFPLGQSELGAVPPATTGNRHNIRKQPDIYLHFQTQKHMVPVKQAAWNTTYFNGPDIVNDFFFQVPLREIIFRACTGYL